MRHLALLSLRTPLNDAQARLRGHGADDEPDVQGAETTAFVLRPDSTHAILWSFRSDTLDEIGFPMVSERAPLTAVMIVRHWRDTASAIAWLGAMTRRLGADARDALCMEAYVTGQRVQLGPFASGRWAVSLQTPIKEAPTRPLIASVSLMASPPKRIITPPDAASPCLVR
jgi:hypothetical protein